MPTLALAKRAFYRLFGRWLSTNTSSVARASIDSLDQAFLEDLVHRLGWRENEHLICLFGDRACDLIAEETLVEGNASEVFLSARHLIGRALAHDARTFVLIHNHPSGDPRPSAVDVFETQVLAELARRLDLELVDHLVVGGSRIHSICRRAAG
ncbi:MAG: JAB domain-containing protein [Erythrobacter sp.]|nr:JAB domain-containing protein [Erythrobacter sp.]